MTTHQQEEHVFPYYRSPSAIRGQVFTHRVRGLDEAEVREYLDLLADQVQAADHERAEVRAENERLRAENARLRGDAPGNGSDDISPQAVALFSQAQQVADQLVEEAVRHARDLMTAARAQQREILQQAHEAAEAAAREARPLHPSEGQILPMAPVAEVEYVRTFARVAQVQLRSVLEALAEQVDKLGEVSAPNHEVRSLFPAPGAGPVTTQSYWQISATSASHVQR